MTGLAIAMFFAALAFGGWLNLRARLGRLERHIRQLRELAGRPLRYRRLVADDQFDLTGITAAFDLSAGGSSAQDVVEIALRSAVA